MVNAFNSLVNTFSNFVLCGVVAFLLVGAGVMLEQKSTGTGYFETPPVLSAAADTLALDMGQNYLVVIKGELYLVTTEDLASTKVTKTVKTVWADALTSVGTAMTAATTVTTKTARDLFNDAKHLIGG